jgi:CheY-like chemotaxis protein
LIAITGYADEAHRQRGVEAGFDLYLVKPIEPSALEILLLLERFRLAKDPHPASATHGGPVVEEARKRGVLQVGMH